VYLLYCITQDNKHESLFKQSPGEHVQAFAWRLHQYTCKITGKSDIPDSMVFPKVLLGLHPSVGRLLPFPIPSNLEELFVFAETIPDIIPKDDPFWAEVESRRLPTPEQPSVKDAQPSLTRTCYKCSTLGHFAWQCKEKRVMPKDKKRKKRLRRKVVGVSFDKVGGV
jgi:hypothetical protein